MRYVLSYLFICIIIPLWSQQYDALGQQNNLYPDFHTGYFYNLATINPAYTPSETKLNFIASHKNRTGPFTKIVSYSFVVEKSFWNNKKRAHVGRILLWNEKEGPYIQKPRAYGNYAYMLSLSENTTLSAGLALGFAQLAFTAPTATGSGSAIYPDGALGLALKTKTIKTGISSMQVFNSGMKIINAPFKLRRYYTFYFAAEKDLSSFWTIKSYSIWRFLPEITNRGETALAFDFKQLFTSGCSIKSIGGLAVFASFTTNIGSSKLLLNFIYNTPFLSIKNNFLNSFEITSGYGIGPINPGVVSD